MPSLFISYRGADSPDAVEFIHKGLKQRLPRWEIFCEDASIPQGEQFTDRLKKVTSATAVLVIIGPKWVELLRDRRNAGNDHVRQEVHLALKAGASVVPVLVGNAAMPTDTDLADCADLQPLLQRHATSVRPDPNFTNDLESIVTHLKSLEAADPSRSRTSTVSIRAPRRSREDTEESSYDRSRRRRRVSEDGEDDPPPALLIPPTRQRRGTGSGLWEWLGNQASTLLSFGKTARDQVDATVFAPPTVQPGHEFLVQVFAHLPAQGDQAQALAREFDQQAERRGITSLELEIARGERLTFHLTLPGLTIDHPQADLVWHGQPRSVQFIVRVPLGHVPGTLIGTVTASLNSVPVGHIKFKLTVAQTTPRTSQTEPLATGETAQRYRHAFISYASADRASRDTKNTLIAPAALDCAKHTTAQLRRAVASSPDNSVPECLCLVFQKGPRRSGWAHSGNAESAPKSRCIPRRGHYEIRRKLGNATTRRDLPACPRQALYVHFYRRFRFGGILRWGVARRVARREGRNVVGR